MIIVGLTGGIGSGKTTVSKLFKALEIPVYIADDEAKKLMNRSKIIKKKLIALFGEQAYLNGVLNNSYLAQIVFNDKSYLNKISTIVHPKVASHFKRWVKKQTASYVVKEVAILFENGGYKSCDFIITVTAPKDLKIQRILKRDNTTEKKIEAIMRNQWEDSKKIELSDFVIKNTALNDTKAQVLEIHQKILKKII